MTDAAHAERMAKSALVYAQCLGWPVFPLSGKRPAIAGGHGCLDATLDPVLVKDWWRHKYPGANVGVATGREAGVWGLDIDGPTGEETLAELEKQHGLLPQTIESHTGGGGRHLFFRMPIYGMGNAVRFAPGLDVRGTAGYVVAPPSRHPDTHREYVWSVDGHPTETVAADAPEWLLNLIAAPLPGGVRGLAGTAGKHPLRALMQGTAVKGTRNDILARLAGYLFRKCDTVVAVALLQAWNQACCDPPLSNQEVEGVLQSIASLELRRRQNDG